jgi:hypothetical protein
MLKTANKTKAKRHSTRTASSGMERVDDTWQIQNDLQTLTSAEKIRKDSSRMAKVKKLAADQMKDLTKISA